MSPRVLDDIGAAELSGEDLVVPQAWHTREGWTDWVTSAPVPPPLVANLEALSSTDREAYDDARFDYLGEEATIGTLAYQRALTITRRLVITNRGKKSARRGVILDGPPGTGKTTTLTTLGRSLELNARSRQLTQRTSPRPSSLIPVIHVSVPYAARPKMLAMEFARFLGLPIANSSRVNVAEVTEAVCRVACATQCQLVLVDELQNISLDTQVGSEVSDHLKYFAEHIPATFIYSGFDLYRSGMFAGPRGRQIATRFTRVDIDPYRFGSTADRELWQETITGFEDNLQLHNHRRKSLSRLATYLYRRTGGMIGSLSQLIRGAAVDAILDGSERITKAHLDNIELDLAAEEYYTRSRHTTRAKASATPRTSTSKRGGPDHPQGAGSRRGSGNGR